MVDGDAVGCEVTPITVFVPPELVQLVQFASVPPLIVIFAQVIGATVIVLPPGAVAATSAVIKK
jgi:hypothetical protein